MNQGKPVISLEYVFFDILKELRENNNWFPNWFNNLFFKNPFRTSYKLLTECAL
jgi:hypothetical protein